MPKREQEPVTEATQETDNLTEEEIKATTWDGLTPEATTQEAETLTEPSELDKLKAKVQELETREFSNVDLAPKYKNLQRKYETLQRERGRPTSPPTGGDDRLIELMIQQARDRKDELGNPVNDPTIPQLEAELSARKNVERQRQQMVWQEQRATDEREKLEERITSVGHDPSDEMFLDVWEAFDLANALDGKFERADRKLDRALKNVKPTDTPTKPVKQESEEEVRKRIENEVRKQIMSERGELDVESGQPSGSAQSFQDIEKGYIAGRVTIEKYEEAKRKSGRT